MELGRVENMDSVRINNSEQVKKVNNVGDKSEVIQNDQYKNKLGINENENPNEVMLDNVKFGYDKEAKDFFIKFTDGNIERTFPTKDIMRARAYLVKTMEEIQK